MTSKKAIYSLLLAALFLITGCGKNKELQTSTTKFVKVEKVANNQQREKLVFNGKIQEKSLTALSFRVGGPLMTLKVKSGDYMKEGDLIAVIDKRDYKLNKQTAEASYIQAKGEYERYKELHEKNKVPANSFEKIEAGYLMAKAGYENAVNQLKDTELRAPYSGYVHEKFVENYQTVGPGQPIVSIIDLSRLEVLVSVPENQLNDIKNCEENYLAVRNANVSKVPVSILSLAEKASGGGLYDLKFIFKNEKSMNIAPGMSAEVTMYCEREGAALNIPVEAVFNKDNSTYVWVYDDSLGIITRRKVTVGNIKSGGVIEVNSGLERGELIITAGVNSLFENQKVHPVQKPSKTNVGGLL